MRIDTDIKLDFKDVLLVPQRSSLDSRAEAKLERTFKFRHSSRQITCVPCIAANMDTTGSFAMASSLGSRASNMMVALHKHYSEESLLSFFHCSLSLWSNVFVTIGASESDIYKLQRIRTALLGRNDTSGCFDGIVDPAYFPYLLCVDVANGYAASLTEQVKRAREAFPDSVIMAGNVVTGNMTEELILAGADIVKAGIGGGSTCVTRVKTGVGFPQLSSTDECAYQAHGLRGHICSDGGIRCAGDFCKAFAAGADFVMAGGFFAGTDECEGDWLYEVGEIGTDFCKQTPYKEVAEEYGNNPNFVVKKAALKFHGMASKEAQEKWSNGVPEYGTAEGKECLIPYKGSVKEIAKDILGGLRSCCSYIGASCIKDMPKCASFIRVSRQVDNY